MSELTHTEIHALDDATLDQVTGGFSLWDPVGAAFKACDEYAYEHALDDVCPRDKC